MIWTGTAGRYALSTLGVVFLLVERMPYAVVFSRSLSFPC